MDGNKSKISNVEWGLVIGALFTMDAIEALLDWMFIGFFLNPFLDLLVGMSLALYLQLRGESLSNPKRLFGLLSTFGFEVFPFVSEFPLWGFYGIFSMSLSKKESLKSQILGKSPLNFQKKPTPPQQRHQEESMGGRNNT